MEITTRKAAVASGASKYFTGEPCKWGHIVERYTQSGTCSGCLSAGRGAVGAQLAQNSPNCESQAVLGDRRREALNSLQPLKVRAYVDDWAHMKMYAFAVLTMRYPGVLQAWDAFDKRPGKDGKGGTLLYVVHAHPADHAAIKAEENRLLRLRAPDVALLRRQAFGQVAQLIADETEAPPAFTGR